MCKPLRCCKGGVSVSCLIAMTKYPQNNLNHTGLFGLPVPRVYRPSWGGAKAGQCGGCSRAIHSREGERNGFWCSLSPFCSVQDSVHGMVLPMFSTSANLTQKLPRRYAQGFISQMILDPVNQYQTPHTEADALSLSCTSYSETLKIRKKLLETSCLPTHASLAPNLEIYAYFTPKQMILGEGMVSSYPTTRSLTKRIINSYSMPHPMGSCLKLLESIAQKLWQYSEMFRSRRDHQSLPLVV